MSKYTDSALKNMLLKALDLSGNEKAVLTVLENQKMARDISKIAKDAGVPRTTASYILRKFRKFKLAREIHHEKRSHWMYNRQIDHIK